MVGLIHDLRCHLPIAPSKEESQSPKRWDADLDWRACGGVAGVEGHSHPSDPTFHKTVSQFKIHTYSKLPKTLPCQGQGPSLVLTLNLAE